jgi:hypothetical protein
MSKIIEESHENSDASSIKSVSDDDELMSPLLSDNSPKIGYRPRLLMQ